jgi:septal ring factor EnvC (AmiA/AmiB activator)
MSHATAAADPDADERVTLGPLTRMRGPLFWALFTLTAMGAWEARGVIEHQQSGSADTAELKSQIAVKANADDLKKLAENVVSKDYFEARMTDFQHQLTSLVDANKKLSDDLADARREQATAAAEARTRADRQEDLIRELSKHP